MSTVPDSQREQPVGELLRELSSQTSLLVRQELELARLEVTEKGKQAGVGAGLLGGAGLTALTALIALMLTVLAALDTAMDTWLAALITTVIFAVVAGVEAQMGRARLKQVGPPVPEQATDSVKEDVAWAKTQARSART